MLRAGDGAFGRRETEFLKGRRQNFREAVSCPFFFSRLCAILKGRLKSPRILRKAGDGKMETV